MQPVVMLGLGVPVFAGLAFLFGRNAYKGVRTGAVWVKSAHYIRSDEPTLFWVGICFSTLFAAASVAAILIAIWALVTLT